jgi:hypothetical protein
MEKGLMRRPSRWLPVVFLAAASVSAPAFHAAAHDAQRVKFVASVRIAAPPAKVWEVIGHFHDLSWDNQVAKTTGTGSDVPDATRTVVLKSGGVLPDEELERYEPENFTYATFLPHVDVKVFPVTNFSSILVVLPEPDGGSKVEWRCAFYRGYPNFGPPPELNEAAAIKAVSALTQPALDGLKARLEKPIPTN